MPKIAYLGWGSLLWQGYFRTHTGLIWQGYYSAEATESKGEYDFLKSHLSWRIDGPLLPLEFSRVSTSRRGALTLVIDRRSTTDTQVSWCLSKNPDVEGAVSGANVSSHLQHAIKVLAEREGMSDTDRIGRWPNGDWQPLDKDTLDTIAKWATTMALDGAVWVDLASNFEPMVRSLVNDGAPKISVNREQLKAIVDQPFSVQNAITYLRALSGKSRGKALEYIQRAPTFVRTRVRDALEQMAVDRALTP
jgi:hypothetical protein